MGILLSSDRCMWLVGFAKNKLASLKELLGAVNARVNVRGYGVSLFSAAGVDRIKISAPPGAVVCSQTGGDFQYRYADWYGGDLVPLLDRAPAEGFTPRALFSAVGDVMYHGYSGLSVPLGVYGTLAAAWPAPRSDIPADPTATSGGYLSGVGFLSSSITPSVISTAGIAFTRAKLLFAAVANETNPTTRFTEAALLATSPSSRVLAEIDYAASLPGFTGGLALYARPVWGFRGMLVYAFYLGACGSAAGSCGVAIHYLEADAAATAGGLFELDVITDDTIATALGTPAPCDGSGTEGAAATALLNLVGSYWPVGELPMVRGMFSCNEHDVCCWGPTPPTSAIKGVIFAADGAVTVESVSLPPYDDTQEKPVITEVSPGVYVCEIWQIPDPTAYVTNAVYYGSPFGTWVELEHPDGVILRHRAITAAGADIVAQAIVYDPIEDATTLYDYDSTRTPTWEPRGKICDGSAGRADVAVFGDHKYAADAAENTPARWLWL